MTTILVVDDEPDIVSTLHMVLQLEGYDVLEASHGQEALQVIAETRPDLVISDLMMPVMDGLELLAAIKSDPELRTIPVIAMSAGRPEAGARPHPWDAFLAKPFTFTELVELIHRALG